MGEPSWEEMNALDFFGLPSPEIGQLPAEPDIRVVPVPTLPQRMPPPNFVPIAPAGSQPSTPAQTPPTDNPPPSLDTVLPQAPQPLNLPPFQPMSKWEEDIYLPVFALAKGFSPPDDDDFVADLYLNNLRGQLQSEMKLLSFDAYRRTLEMRAEHDQRIRQLFAPIASDFNSVFSAEALNAALSEVIDAYKATNPKVSWNKLSPDARMRFIRGLAQQGKLPPSLKNMMEQWSRLKSSFINYRQLLHPQDAQVVAELERLLGGSFDQFVQPFLVRKDPQEELEEQQRKHIEFLLSLQSQTNPPVGGSVGGGTGMPTLGGGGFGGGSLGRFVGGGGGGGAPETNLNTVRRQIFDETNQLLNNIRKNVSVDNRGKVVLPKIENVSRDTRLTGIFGVNSGEEVLAVASRILNSDALLHLQDIIRQNPSINQLEMLVGEGLTELRNQRGTAGQQTPLSDKAKRAIGALVLLQYAAVVRNRGGEIQQYGDKELQGNILRLIYENTNNILTDLNRQAGERATNQSLGVAAGLSIEEDLNYQRATGQAGRTALANINNSLERHKGILNFVGYASHRRNEPLNDERMNELNKNFTMGNSVKIKDYYVVVEDVKTIGKVVDALNRVSADAVFRYYQQSGAFGKQIGTLEQTKNRVRIIPQILKQGNKYQLVIAFVEAS